MATDSDSSLIATLGLTTGDFDEALSATTAKVATTQEEINALLKANGVNWEEQPQKYAAASAKAFAEVEATEKSLAEFRARTAADRMSDEEKLAALRERAAQLQSEIGAIEGSSVEKNQALLELEKNKIQQADLQKGLDAEQAAREAELASQQRAAQESLSSSEKSLAEFRARTAADRMSDEEKLAALRERAAQLQSEIGAIEGSSVEKNQALLELEKNKIQQADLQNGLDAERAAREAELASQQRAAQESLTSSEKSLAEFRAQTALKRMSDEERLAFFQKEAVGLQQQIAGIEGQSAEKNQLLLQYEQKKNQIFDLNAKIQGDSLVTTKATTEETAKQPAVLDTIKGSFKDIGVAIKGVGIGIIFAEFVNLSKQAIDGAQKTRDALEAAGKSVDVGTRSLAAFGDGIDGIKKGAVDFVGFFISGWTNIGDLIGQGINRLRGIDEAQENLNESTTKQAAAQEARLAKLREEQHNVDAIATARKAFYDAERTAATAGQNDQQKMNTLVADHARISEQIQNTEAGTVLYWERKKLLAENEKAAAELRVQIQQKEKDTAEKIGAAEDAIAKAKAQNATYAEKLSSLDQQIATHVIAASQAGSDRLKYATEETKVAALQAEREKLIADQRKAAALSMADELEIFKLQQKSVSGLGDAEQARLELLRLQKQEKQKQLEIEQLEEKLIAGSITPAEKEHLSALIKQDDQIQQEIKTKQSLIDSIGTQTSSEQGVTAELEKQTAEIQKQNQVRADGGGPLGLHDLSNLSTASLQAELQQLSAQLSKAVSEQNSSAVRVGNPFNIGTNVFLESQINSVKDELSFRQNFSKAYETGGTTGALNYYTQQGGDALSFDTALSNMSSWGKGLDLLGQQGKDQIDAITKIGSTLDSLVNG